MSSKRRIPPEVWDWLCRLEGTYCPFTWLSPWEALNVRIDTTARMIQLASEHSFADLRADLAARFNRLERERIALLTPPPVHGRLAATELPLIGKLAQPAGISVVAPKDAQQQHKGDTE